MGERITDRVPGSAAPAGQAPVLSLEKIASGIDMLDAIVVFHIGDGHLHAAWASPRGGLRPDDLAGGLRDAYRACLAASHVFAAPSGRAGRSDPGATITIELSSRLVMMKRSRSFGVACLFDASMPLGMARLVASRVTSTIEPDLPIVSVGGEALPSAPGPAAPASATPASTHAAPTSAHATPISASAVPVSSPSQPSASSGAGSRPLPIAPAAITSPMASSLPLPIAPSMGTLSPSGPHTSPMASSLPIPAFASPMASSLPPNALARQPRPAVDATPEISAELLADIFPETPPAAPPAPPAPEERRSAPEVDRDLPPRTLEFPSVGAAVFRKPSGEPDTGEVPSDADRIRRALDYLREHAPEPHVAALRVALRAGVTPMALERTGALSPSKALLIEAAIEDILGVDLSDLGRVL